MYLEHAKKIAIVKNYLEQALISKGDYPDSKRVKQILSDLDTRGALFEYKNVYPDTGFDTNKFNDDLYIIKKDLEVLYDIVKEIATKKYVELEAYVNGYLLTLERQADMIDRKAAEEVESTALNAKIVYFTDYTPAVKFETGRAVIDIGKIECEAQSRIYGTLRGTGFYLQDAVFDFDGQKISPFDVNQETIKNGGSLTKKVYEYNLNGDDPTGTGFRIVCPDININSHNRYTIYSDKNKMDFISASEHTHKDFQSSISETVESETTIEFYLYDATHISIECSQEPISKSFDAYESYALRRDKFYRYSVTLAAGTHINIETDGTPWAANEKAAVNDDSLYVATPTISRNFIIIEETPGEKVSFNNVKLYIYEPDINNFSVSSIAVKEISDLEVTL